MNTQVDKKIHDLRSYLGLSLRAFGEPIGYTGTHILRIEQKAVNPSEQFIVTDLMSCHQTAHKNCHQIA